MELYRDPQNKFVRWLYRLSVDELSDRGGQRWQGRGCRAGTHPCCVGDPSAGGDLPVIVGIRPEHLEIEPGNTLTVELTEALGGVSYAYSEHGSGVRGSSSRNVGMIGRAHGTEVGLKVAASRICLFDARNRNNAFVKDG